MTLSVHLLRVAIREHVRATIFPHISYHFVVHFNTFVIYLYLLVVRTKSIVFNVRTKCANVVGLHLAVRYLHTLLLSGGVAFVGNHGRLSLPRGLSLLRVGYVRGSSRPGEWFERTMELQGGHVTPWEKDLRSFNVGRLRSKGEDLFL